MPDLLKLVPHHLARRIKIIFGLGAHALVAGAHGFPQPVTAMEKFAKRARALGRDRLLQAGRRRLDGAGFGILALLGLPVREKAAPLRQMKERASDMMRRQRAVERGRAQGVGIKRLEPLSLALVARYQAAFDQERHQLPTPAQITVAPPSRPPRQAPCHRVRGARLRIAAVRIDPHPAGPKPPRLPGLA